MKPILHFRHILIVLLNSETLCRFSWWIL